MRAGGFWGALGGSGRLWGVARGSVGLFGALGVSGGLSWALVGSGSARLLGLGGRSSEVVYSAASQEVCLWEVAAHLGNPSVADSGPPFTPQKSCLMLVALGGRQPPGLRPRCPPHLTTRSGHNCNGQPVERSPELALCRERLKPTDPYIQLAPTSLSGVSSGKATRPLRPMGPPQPMDFPALPSQKPASVLLWVFTRFAPCRCRRSANTFDMPSTARPCSGKAPGTHLEI